MTHRQLKIITAYALFNGSIIGSKLAVTQHERHGDFLDSIVEALITLGITPRIYNAKDIRRLYVQNKLFSEVKMDEESVINIIDLEFFAIHVMAHGYVNRSKCLNVVFGKKNSKLFLPLIDAYKELLDIDFSMSTKRHSILFGVKQTREIIKRIWCCLPRSFKTKFAGTYYS